MERTTKIKLSLGILLFLLALRLILSFFPTPIEFAPYDAAGTAGELQTVTCTEIRYALAIQSENGSVTYYYRITATDGTAGLVASSTKYADETFTEPVTFTGMLIELPAADDLFSDSASVFYTQIVVSDSFLTEYGSKPDAYRSVCDMAALNLDYTQKTRDSIATQAVSVLAFGAFCWMLAMLLKEYSAGKKEKKAKKEE